MAVSACVVFKCVFVGSLNNAIIVIDIRTFIKWVARRHNPQLLKQTVALPDGIRWGLYLLEGEYYYLSSTVRSSLHISMGDLQGNYVQLVILWYLSYVLGVVV